MGLTYPLIDPIAFSVGPVDVRWYGIAYFFGFIGGYAYACYLGRLSPRKLDAKTLSDFLFFIILGVVIGGRLGYVLFYDFQHYISHPSQILKTWDGGMSFHGGALGVIFAVILFGYYKKLSSYMLGDVVVSVVPIGLFFGRLANFINGELYGRVTTSKWGIVFPGGGPLPRHPSQLYEALLEGLILLVLMILLNKSAWVRQRAGLLTGVFFIYYGVARAFVELFREPDAHIGYVFGTLTMGQLLSLPMLLIGGFFLYRAKRID